MTTKEALKLHEDATVLLSFVLKKDKAFLFTYSEKRLAKKQKERYLGLIRKRKQGWPAAYLTGHKEFYGLDFLVTPDVLIPRPETEGLVELVLEKIKNQRSNIKILDAGTGSGCIIISLGKALYQLSSINYQLFASDISEKALAVAKKNAHRHKVKVTFKHGDLLKPWKNQRFDIIVANLPYLTKQTASTKFGPKNALIAKNHGLGLIEKLFGQLSHLRGVRSFDRTTKQSYPKAIFVEFDPRQTKQIKTLTRKLLPDYKLKFFKDLAGSLRFACLTAF